MSFQLHYVKVRNSRQALHNIFLTSSTRCMPFSIFGGEFSHLFFCFTSYCFQSLPQCLKLYLFFFDFLDLPFPFHKFWAATLSEKKNIQGSMHLICIMNRLHKRATFERKQNKNSNEQDGRGILIKVVLTCRSPQATKAWLP